MACIPEASTNALGRLYPFIIGDRTECPQRRLGIFKRVDWRHFRAAPSRIALVELINLRFLYVCGIGQHACQQVDRAVRCIDGAGEPFLHEFRNQAGVVDMSVGQQNKVDVVRFEGKIPVVEGLEGLGT